MPIYALGEKVPTIDPDAYVHPDAVLIGDVRLGPGATVWPGTVLRGDASHIEVGARTSIQDGTVIHCADAMPTVVGEECVVGHMVHLEGCTIGRWTLVGSGSIVLNLSSVGQSCLIGAQAVISNNVHVPPNSRALGVPAKITEGVVADNSYADAVEHYVQRGRLYSEQLRRLD